MQFSQHLIDVIDRQEGGSLTNVYFPSNAQSSTGPTVARGVDLGAYSEADLRAAGLSEETIDKLRRFLGKTGDAAKQEVAIVPGVTITSHEADLLNQHALARIASTVEQRYDAARGTPGEFSRLPDLVRTAIIDLAYQYGPNLPVRTPRVWQYLTEQRWAEAVHEFRNFGDAFGSRRKEEAEFIELATAVPLPTLDINTVLGVQRALIVVGIDPGPADGRNGRLTQNAILKFQRAWNQATTSDFVGETGELDAGTRDVLESLVRNLGYPVLSS
ncbi:pesticin C-terminus-like muramidase [Leptolyngbya sp. FACHB-711]|uniref:pesticin C-terminus-like muramidase n=1 Tax=unclassified Leptolyngbya TaxID=2650499 RepID=UPI001688F136|nr:pesticin C-terminus-like muramidase [Leptolyngbya sp. FACHB-711]MBD2024984.1 peptidoglycan-binding protein [Leptolyngbya sp. FACHB-711]